MLSYLLIKLSSSQKVSYIGTLLELICQLNLITSVINKEIIQLDNNIFDPSYVNTNLYNSTKNPQVYSSIVDPFRKSHVLPAHRQVFQNFQSIPEHKWLNPFILSDGRYIMPSSMSKYPEFDINRQLLTPMVPSMKKINHEIPLRKSSSSSFRGVNYGKIKDWHVKPESEDDIQNLGEQWAKRQENGCDGFENFRHDLEIVALMMTLFSFTVGITALALHIINQSYELFSVNGIGTIERLSWLIEQFQSGTIEENVLETIENIGFVDYLVTKWVSLPIGNLIIVLDITAHIVGAIALILDATLTFPQIATDTFQLVFGIDLEHTFEGYGCLSNTFSDFPIAKSFEASIKRLYKFTTENW